MDTKTKNLKAVKLAKDIKTLVQGHIDAKINKWLEDNDRELDELSLAEINLLEEMALGWTGQAYLDVCDAINEYYDEQSDMVH